MMAALVILSGGQDSTTCLYWALHRFGAGHVAAVTFDYGCFYPTPRKGKINLMSIGFIARDLAPKGLIGVTGNQSINVHY